MIFGAGLLLAVLVVGALIGASIAARRRAPLPRGGGGLAACPSSPNCVSSAALDPAHHVEPIALPAGLADPIETLAALLAGWPRARIVEHAPNYLRAEVETPLFRFVDDLELLLDMEARVIHVRSASRVGHSDLGANRRRVEALRAAFARSGSDGPR